MRCIARWWNCPEIEIYEIEGKYIALYGWNGEVYLGCWEVEKIIGTTGFGEKTGEYVVRPIYEGKDDDFETVGYEFVN